MRRLRVAVERPYDVVIGPGVISELAALPGRCAVVVDERVEALHGARVREALAGHEVTWIRVGQGEDSKSVLQLSVLWDRFADFRLERHEHVVAIGGGVVGDLAGFAAATWRRGVPFVQVPTTLLAQVDASVGGKVAIDHAGLKNPVGAFHQPVLVLADTSFLGSLPERERWSGAVEVAKAGLLAGEPLFSEVTRSLDALASGAGPVEALVAACVVFKAGLVQRDPEERGERALLNLGHTIGHALEAASEGRLLHGEAVAWGLRGMLALAGDVAPEVTHLVERLPAPSLRGLTTDDVLARLVSDKKASGGRPRFVFCTAPGVARWGVEVDSERVVRVVEQLLERGA